MTPPDHCALDICLKIMESSILLISDDTKNQTQIDLKDNESFLNGNVENSNETSEDTTTEMETNTENDLEDFDYEEEDEIKERITLVEIEQKTENGLDAGFTNPEIEVEESAFGRKIRKRKKKMETRLLKEILNDVKLTSKRH